MSTQMLKYIMIITVVLFVGIIIAYVILKKMMGKSEYAKMKKLLSIAALAAGTAMAGVGVYGFVKKIVPNKNNAFLYDKRIDGGILQR